MVNFVFTELVLHSAIRLGPGINSTIISQKGFARKSDKLITNSLSIITFLFVCCFAARRKKCPSVMCA